ncbi:tRNA (cytosine-5-)-methyltransferase [Rhizophlyctis rosea]|uniref:tRNA (Cytosine-5-)-methyltransferase n=1 Tax=Rhizophlyctis rosea TaxID=64517 RepID=A0AAD5SE63_9FUNG|nr:tRNA (cytosine-5-)-methyltransferase [Rhizophlyctis rosea]
MSIPSYKHNFGIAPFQTGIEHVTPKYLAPFRANAWFMSPPCQPYTRMGKQRDDQDPRAKGLLHLIDLLGTLPDPPSYIFMENVLNFEKSRSRDRLISQLVRLNYTYTEWMLTPTQLGIPNDRMRYYLTARRNTTSPSPESLPPKIDAEQVIAPPPQLQDTWPYASPFGPEHRNDLGFYLEDGIDIGGDGGWKVPDAFVRTRSFFSEFVIAKPTDTRTCCFTKAYGHHGLGAGAFLQTCNFDVGDMDAHD